MKKDNESLRMKIELNKIEKNIHEEKIIKAQNNIEVLKKENEKLNIHIKQIESKMKEYEEANNQNKLLNKENSKLRDQIHQMGALLTELESQMDKKVSIEIENEKLHKKVVQIEAKIREKEEDNNKIKKENGTLRKKVAQMEAKIREKEEDNNKIKKENETLRKRIEKNNSKKNEDENDNELRNYLFALKEKVHKIEFVNNDDYKEEAVIGEGSKSTVKIVSKNEKYVKKELSEFTHSTLKHFIAEGEILFKLRHPCIIRIHGFNLGSHLYPPFMILSLETQSLETAIKEDELNQEQINRIIIELVLGMRYIHNHKIIHRSLKPSNILLSENNHVRISDFGLAKEDDLEKSRSKGVKNLVFMAPELFEEDEDEGNNEKKVIKYTNKVDVYSFGITLIYIITKDYPKFRFKRVKTGSLPPLPSKISAWCNELITKCLSFSAEERPTFSEIFEIIKENNYDFFNDIKNKSEIKDEKLIRKQQIMKDIIEARITKIIGFEFQHQSQE